MTATDIRATQDVLDALVRSVRHPGRRRVPGRLPATPDVLDRLVRLTRAPPPPFPDDGLPF